jgi:uncharacterized protein YkwD
VRGASPSHEERSTLNIAAQLGLYAMLAGLVAASFVVTPERSSELAVATETPAVTEAAAASTEAEPARIVALARGSRSAPRDVEYVVISYSPEPIGETAADMSSVPEAKPDPTPELTPEPTTELTPEPVAETPEPTPPPTPKPAPPPPTAPPVAIPNERTAWAEAHMLELINASRTSAGLAALAVDEKVAAVARAHSAVEAQVRYVFHDGPDGTAKSRNAPACGTGWWGENTGKIWRDNVDALHIEFMNEPWIPLNHRTVIMDPTFRRVGIGAVFGPDAMYMTMVFCR